VNLGAVLKSRYPTDVVDVLLNAYREIEENFALGKWKASELDAGHFVEAARRLVEFELGLQVTPVGAQLSKFTDNELKKYEQQSAGHESFRKLIPRVLKSVYNIRNNRGVGHVGAVSPNAMDATLILYSAKWVLAEFTSHASGLPIAETQALVDSIVERQMEVIWKDDGITRVLDISIKARDQVLLLLYDTNNQHEDQLRNTIEYSNKTKFRAILKDLHKKRLIEYHADADSTACRAAIPRDAGPVFHGMPGHRSTLSRAG